MDSVCRMYGGDVELVFDEKKHRYTVNGTAVPSVTSIVGVLDKSGPLVGWSLKVAGEYATSEMLNLEGKPSVDDVDRIVKNMKSLPRQKTKWAASIGTQAHDWIERHIKAQLRFDSMPDLPADERVLNCVNAFLAWEREHIVEYEASEQRIYSREHHFAGTLDVLACVDRQRMVLDLKTSSGIYPEYILQTAGYQLAYEEEHGVDIEGRIILRIDKETAEFSHLQLEDGYFNGDWDVFLSCLKVYNWIKDKSPV